MNDLQKHMVQVFLSRYLDEMKQYAHAHNVPSATAILYSLLDMLAEYTLSPEQYVQVKQMKDLHLQALYGTHEDA